MTTPLVQLTAKIVSSHASGSQLSSADLIQEINSVFTALKQLETEGTAIESGELSATSAPALSIKQAFRKDQIACMICGKTGFKTLARHLNIAHNLKPGQYRKQFNIPTSQSLTAKNYSETRRQAANDNNLAANLEKARAVRAAKNAPSVKTESIVVPVVSAAAEIPAKSAKSVKPTKAAKAPRKTKAAQK
jgi:predicted transcriptional regulator